MTKLFIRTAMATMICGTLAAPAFAQQVSVTLKDGLVTIKAENATVRQILDEWARVGQAKVINGEKLGGTPLTLTLVGVPERQALDTILRGTSGYLAVDRSTPSTTASAYESIVVMNKTTQAVNSVASAGGASTTPSYVPPPVADTSGQDVEEMAAQHQNAMDPPAPTNAPVANPYAGGGVGMSATGGGAGAYSNGTVNGGANGNTVNANPADVKFDYANPVPYFEAQRQLQQQQQQQQQQQASQPTSTPGGTTLTAQPGLSPTPNTSNPSTNQGTGTGTNTNPNTFNPYNPPANFNPYNLKPGETIPGTTPQGNVTPDRSKYANPYQPQQP